MRTTNCEASPFTTVYNLPLITSSKFATWSPSASHRLLHHSELGDLPKRSCGCPTKRVTDRTTRSPVFSPSENLSQAELKRDHQSDELDTYHHCSNRNSRHSRRRMHPGCSPMSHHTTGTTSLTNRNLIATLGHPPRSVNHTPPGIQYTTRQRSRLPNHSSNTAGNRNHSQPSFLQPLRRLPPSLSFCRHYTTLPKPARYIQPRTQKDKEETRAAMGECVHPFIHPSWPPPPNKTI